jgi:hypothetical protein
MTDDKWQEIVEMAQKNFRGAKLSHEDLIVQKEEGPEKQGTQDILEFEHPNGDRYKLIRENKPVVLEKKRTVFASCWPIRSSAVQVFTNRTFS